MIKKCSKCGVEKELELFSACKSAKDGRRSDCKECCSMYKKKYRSNPDNKEKEKKYQDELRLKKGSVPRSAKPKKILTEEELALKKEEKRRYNREYARRPEVKARQKKYDEVYTKTPHSRLLRKSWMKTRRTNNHVFKLADNMRTRIRHGLDSQDAPRHFENAFLVGMSWEDLAIYLEKMFEPGMSWDNYTRRGWHVDHIFPVNDYDLTDPAQQLKCFHYTNIQPLWWWDNQGKARGEYKRHQKKKKP